MRSLTKMVFVLTVALSQTAVQAEVTAMLFHSGDSLTYNSIKHQALKLDLTYDLMFVDTDKPESIAKVEAYGVQALPMIVFMEDGVEIDRIAGAGDQWHIRAEARFRGDAWWRGYRTTVRVGITNGVSGTGVIIRSEPGKTLVVTAKHVTDAGGESAATFIELFREDMSEVFLAECVASSPDADVSLLLVTSNEYPLPVALSGDSAKRPVAGDSLRSYGCSLGAKPTWMPHTYLGLSAGILHVSGFPHRGRSGGPLYNNDYQLVGICHAQNIEFNRGMFVDRDPLYAMIKVYDASLVEQ